MPSRIPANFNRNVFINCPFDQEYLSLLRPLLFTILYCGLNPRIALESSDSGEVRINKICTLIRESRYSIHDLSRLQAQEQREFYRMNMPFELGIEYGCRQFGSSYLKTKRCLILEKSKYDYVKALSDLAGVDIKSHGDDPEQLVAVLRDWFVETVGLRGLESPTKIWYDFYDFMSAFYDKRRREGFTRRDIERMPIPEFIHFIELDRLSK
jgi:hypothetical protein